MKQADIGQRLVLIEETLARIELALHARVPIGDVRQAIEDVFATYGVVAQLREVYAAQRDALAAHYARIDGVLEARGELDAEVRDLLVQERELLRRIVRGIADMERAADWHEHETQRRDTSWSADDVDRRKA